MPNSAVAGPRGWLEVTEQQAYSGRVCLRLAIGAGGKGCPAQKGAMALELPSAMVRSMELGLQPRVPSMGNATQAASKLRAKPAQPKPKATAVEAYVAHLERKFSSRASGEYEDSSDDERPERGSFGEGSRERMRSARENSPPPPPRRSGVKRGRSQEQAVEEGGAGRSDAAASDASCLMSEKRARLILPGDSAGVARRAFAEARNRRDASQGVQRAAVREGAARARRRELAARQAPAGREHAKGAAADLEGTGATARQAAAAERHAAYVHPSAAAEREGPDAAAGQATAAGRDCVAWAAAVCEEAARVPLDARSEVIADPVLAATAAAASRNGTQLARQALAEPGGDMMTAALANRWAAVLECELAVRGPPAPHWIAADTAAVAAALESAQRRSVALRATGYIADAAVAGLGLSDPAIVAMTAAHVAVDLATSPPDSACCARELAVFWAAVMHPATPDWRRAPPAWWQEVCPLLDAARAVPYPSAPFWEVQRSAVLAMRRAATHIS
ncbi:hypothetical protein WJX81_005697 [Elliptochloris bilobata]|uniref:Uncharacterized protein n=1 Tax=Elliptochloris bilobata TaxID=381761 RepID=A0AAW1SKW8_9CHLO